MKKQLLIPVLALLGLGSCNFNRVKGNGHVVSKTYQETGFKDIEVSSSISVLLKQGSEFRIRIDAEENILEQLQVRKEGDKLVIRPRNNTNLSPTREIKVYITAPEYHNLEGSGSCAINSDGLLSGNEIELDLSGAGTTQLKVDVKKLKIDASGSSEIELSGKAVDFSIGGSRSTSVDAFGLETENTAIELSGSGDAGVFASRSLKVDISGAGSVQYKGNPSVIEKDISGSGSIDKAN